MTKIYSKLNRIVRVFGRRIFSSLILITILINIIPKHAFGNPDYTKVVMKQSIIQNINLNSREWLPKQDQPSLSYNLDTLITLSMWIDFATNGGVVDFVSSEKIAYRDVFYNLIGRFNEQYASAPSATSDPNSKYTAFKIDSYDGGNAPNGMQGSVSRASTQTFINKSLDYVENLYKSYLDKYNAVTEDSSKGEFIRKLDAINRSLYNILKSTPQQRDKINGLLTGDGGAGYDINLDKVNTILNNADYKPFFDRAEELIRIKINTSAVELNRQNGDKPEMKFTSATSGADGREWKVNKAFMAAFATSAVYRPFISKVGDTDYAYALESLSKDKELVTTYQEIASRKKPLYLREEAGIFNNFRTGYDGPPVGSSPKGPAERFTVQELFDMVQEDKAGHLVSVKGEFANGKDSDFWEMKQDTGEDVIENGPNAGNNVNNNPSPQNPANPANPADPNATPDPNAPQQPNTNPSVTATDNNAPKETKFDDDGKIVVLGTTIVEEEYMTDSLFYFSEDDPLGHLNMIMLNNIILAHKSQSKGDEFKTESLYITPFGDIVTGDNTVIIPGMANANFLAKSKSYYPYNAAFMNSYPSVSLDSKYFNVSENDKNKYFLAMNVGMGNSDGVFANDYFNRSCAPKADGNSTTTVAYNVKHSDGLKTFHAANETLDLDTGMYNDGDIMISLLLPKSIDFKSNWQIVNEMATMFSTAIVPNTNVVLNTKKPGTIFPYVEMDNDKAEFIAKRAFASITIDDAGQQLLSNGRNNLNFLTDMFLDVCKGKKNIQSYHRNLKNDFKEIIEGDMGRISKTFVEWNRKLVDTFGKVEGVVGFKNAYQDPILGKVLNFVDNMFVYIIAIVFLYFIIVYARRRANIVHSIFGCGSILTATTICLKVIPIWIPIFLNMIMGFASEGLAYKSMYTTEEKYTLSSLKYDDKKTLVKETMGISLYKFTSEDLQNTCELLKLDKEDVTSGTGYVIDEQSGVYLEGDTLKIDSGRLFDTLSIVGKHTNTNGARNIYQFKASKKSSNLVDYYIPFYQLTDSFVDKLNKLNTVFDIPIQSITYADGFSKDNFIVDAYMNSPVFAVPDRLEEIKGQYPEETYNAMKSVFPNNVDFLGLSEVLSDAKQSNKFHDTVWYNTLLRNGYFDSKQKFIDLIEYVNLHTKKFMLDNADNFAYISDENIIKTVVLYAITTMNAKISYFGDVAYPQSVHFEDLNIEQVLIPTIVSNHDLFLTRHGGLADYVYREYGLSGTVIFMFIVVLSFLIVKAMSISVPIMYLALLALLFYRLSKGIGIAVAMKGYSKIFAIMSGSYLVFCATTINLYRIKNSLFALVILLVVYTLVFLVLCNMILAVFTNYLDFGNTKVNASIRSLGNALTLGALGRKLNSMRADRFSLGREDVPTNVGYDDDDDYYGIDTDIGDNFDADVTDYLVKKRHKNYNPKKFRPKSQTRYREDTRDEFIDDDGNTRDLFDDDFI